MKLGFKLAVVLGFSLNWILFFADAFDEQRAWISTNQPYYHYSTYQATQTDSVIKKPAIRPVVSKINVVNSDQSHVPEYPLAPHEPLSRVIVATVHPLVAPKSFQLDGNLETAIISKDLLTGQVGVLTIPVEKILDVTNMAAGKIPAGVPASKVDSIKPTLISRIQLPLVNAESLKEEKTVSPLQQVENAKDNTLEKPLLVPETLNENKSNMVAAVIIEKTEDVKDAIINPVEKIGNLKDNMMEKAVAPLEVVSDIKKTIIGSPQKLSEMKENAGNMISTPLDQAAEVKNALMGDTLSPIDVIKSMMNDTLEAVKNSNVNGLPNLIDKLPNVKETVGDKVGDLKDATFGKLETAAQLPLDKASDLKDMIVNPIEKLENVVGAAAEKIAPPIDKNTISAIAVNPLEKAGNILVSTPLQKLEDVKGDMAPPDQAVEVKNAILGVAISPSDVMKSMLEETLQAVKTANATGLPNLVDKLPNVKDIVGDKLGNLKDATVDKLETVIQLPMNKVSDLKGLVANPIDKLQEAVEATAEKIAPPLKKDIISGIAEATLSKATDLTDGKAPIDKLEEIKETILEAGSDKKDAVSGMAVAPLEKLNAGLFPSSIKNADEIKDALADKADVIKSDVISSTITKLPDNIKPSSSSSQDLKDVVFNAFHQSIVGDRKEYFKQAIAAMSKEALEDLQEALASAFNIKGISLPVLGNVQQDMKDAVHELAISEANSSTKEKLIQIENILEPEKEKIAAVALDAKEKPLEIVQMGNEKKSDLKALNPAQFSISQKLGGDAINGAVANDKAIIGSGGMQGIRRWRRWGASPSTWNRRGSGTGLYFYRYQHRPRGWGWGRGKRSIYGIGTPSQELQKFSPPPRLRIPLKATFRQINSAAPADPYPRSKESLNLPLLTINEVATDKIMMDIKEGLRYVLQTKNEWTFAIHGTGTTGCHAVLDNLIESGDRVLVLINGYWGELMANMAVRLGAQVVRYSKPPGTVFHFDEIEAALKAHRPDMVLVVNGESSAGVRQPLDGIGDLCEKNGALLVVDVVAVAGMQPVLMDKHKVDAVYTSSSKGLGGVAGLAPVSLSPRAVQKIKNRLTPPRAYQTDLALQYQLWNAQEPDRVRFQSSSLPLLYALREALATIVEERAENTFKRHELATEHLNRGLVALGLEHFVENPKDRMIGITTVKPPMGKDPVKIANYMFKNYNVEISSGFGPTKGKVLRFAIYATNADTLRISNLLRALKNALTSRETSVSY